MTDAEITEILDAYPDKVADALCRFKTAGVEKERIYAKSYLDIKARSVGERVTVADIDAMVKSDNEYYVAAIEEVKAESGYIAAFEKLMSAKKQAAMRAAF